MADFVTLINFWVVPGFVGQFPFGSGSFVQRIASEKRGLKFVYGK